MCIRERFNKFVAMNDRPISVAENTDFVEAFKAKL